MHYDTLQMCELRDSFIENIPQQQEAHQVKEVEDFLFLLELLPLDDVASAHLLVLVTGQRSALLHQLQEAAAPGVRGRHLLVG